MASLISIFDHQRQVNIGQIPLADIVGVVTLIALLATLILSIKANRETARATILQALPIIRLRYEIDGDKIFIRNIGNTPAVGITVDSFSSVAVDHDMQLYGLSVLKFKTVRMLSADQNEVELVYDADGPMASLGLMEYMLFNSANPIDVAIRFSDLSGKKFISYLSLSQSDSVVVILLRPYTSSRWLRYNLVQLNERLTINFRRLKASCHRISRRRG